ncbi:unnamed protein product [Soboliphyme baturini]|uniref:KH domain-containing protein n=1 Tax=Soboliphyme baturini TaxID=241478 RepID=A0A183I9L4_9BILA|nr:unnamed protein product [Soboliphyme baturini]
MDVSGQEMSAQKYLAVAEHSNVDNRESVKAVTDEQSDDRCEVSTEQVMHGNLMNRDICSMERSSRESENELSDQFAIDTTRGSIRRPLAPPIGSVYDAKLYVPVDRFPEVNIVGRIIGPKGMNIRRIEQMTGCKISIRDTIVVKKDLIEGSNDNQDGNRNTFQYVRQPYALITCQDKKNRPFKVMHAIEELGNMMKVPKRRNSI